MIRWANNAISQHQWINQGVTQITLQYDDGLIHTGEFRICVEIYDGIESSGGNGYNSEEKKPEYISVNVQ
jgi:hypothetical protein